MAMNVKPEMSRATPDDWSLVLDGIRHTQVFLEKERRQGRSV